MVRKCAIPNCANKYDPGEENGITFHRIPTVPKIGEEWINILEQLQVKINSNTRICSVHFQESQFFMAGSIKKLRKYSVPKVNVTVTRENNPIRSSAPTKMVMCWVPNCTHYNLRDPCKFFKFPRDFHSKKMWIKQIRRTDKHPSARSVVCSCHFYNGLKENGPTIFLTREKTSGKVKQRKKQPYKSLEFTKALEHHNYCINSKIWETDDIHIVAPKNLIEHIPCDEESLDVTLAIEGRYLKANKNILSLFSSYFKQLFETSPCKHPIVFLRDVTYDSINDLLQFMYKGKVQMNQKKFTTFIKTAQYLQISCLANHGDLKQMSTENETKSDTAPFQQEMVKNKQMSEKPSFKTIFLDEKIDHEKPSNKTHQFLTVNVETIDQEEEEEEFGVDAEDPLEYKIIKNEDWNTDCFAFSSEEDIIPFKAEPCDED